MNRKISVLRADLFLLLASFIWGSAFVAQRVGMEFFSPFYFNGLRFLLGGCFLFGILYFSSGTKELFAWQKNKQIFKAGVLLGFLLFTASSLQQVGIQYTTAGKAGFITSLYVVIVPLLSLFFRQKIDLGVIIGVIFAVIGLYLLSIKSNFAIDKGDFLVLLCAFMFSVHVIFIGIYAPIYNCLILAFLQFFVTGILSLFVAILWENLSIDFLFRGAFSLIYAGLFSVGIAYTLQIVAQRSAPPAHAAIILSLESVFAALTGWILLGETMSLRVKLGCTFMLIGVLIAQTWPYLFTRKKELSHS